MKIHHLVHRQFLPVSLEAAWQFFSSPRNLDAITPAHLKFRILEISPDNEVHAGQLIRYKIRLMPAVWVTWLTEITALKAGEYFIDEQKKGPYAVWQHRHHFRQVENGIEMTDEVTYALPYGALGKLAHRLFVRRELNLIFTYRRTTLAAMFRREDENKTIAV